MKIEIPEEILEKVMAESITFAKFYLDKRLNVEKILLDKLWNTPIDSEYSEKIQRIKCLRVMCEEDGSFDARCFREFCQEKYREMYNAEKANYPFCAGNEYTLGLLAAKKLIEYWFNY